MTDERRHYSRITFHSSAKLVFAKHTIDVVVLDLSLKGALVEFPGDISSPVEDNAPCTLHVQLDAQDDQISMDARIAHIKGRKAGLLCLTIDIDSVTHLRRLVELNLGNPDLLERELSALIAE